MSGEAPSAALPTGYRIGEYAIVRVLGAGGFGITYLAFDHQLDGPVAIKEYFPAEVATRGDGWTVSATATTGRDVFAWGLDRFLGEARATHRFRHPNVVRAQRYLEANGTAYIVMEYVEGESLKAILDRRGSLSAQEWRPWMDALLDGLAHVHSHDYLHRDIKPANIVVREADGAPVLIDFGSARLQDGDRKHTQVLTAGYAPIEQYTNDAAQGPPGDIYALAAVSYRVLTGSALASAPDRVLSDDYEPFADQVQGADSRWLAAIDHGLALRPQDRPQSVADWRQALGSADVARTNKNTNNDTHDHADAIRAFDLAIDRAANAGPPFHAVSRTENPANEEPAAVPALPAPDEALAFPEKLSNHISGKAADPYASGWSEKEPATGERSGHVWWGVSALLGLALVFSGLLLLGSLPLVPAIVLVPLGVVLLVWPVMHAGRAVQQDDVETVRWYRRAAEQGYASAQFNLGYMYANGHGVPQDHAIAILWFHRAAERGDTDAQISLGRMYYQGEGVSQDHVEAYMWANLAGTLGSELREILEKDMSAAQIAAARQAAHEWRSTRQ